MYGRRRCAIALSFILQAFRVIFHMQNAGKRITAENLSDFFKERETVLKYDFNGGVRLPEFVLQT